MFNKLVVSTSERRGRRVVKFFCGTSLIYALVIVGVLALSVVISSPRLADTSERMLALIAPPPPPAAPAPRPRDNTPPPVVPRNDPNHVTDLDRVMSAPVKPRTAPPSITQFNEGGVAGGVDPVPGAIGPGVIGSNTPDPGPVPPPAPPAPRPRDTAPQVDTTKPVRLTSSVLQGKAIERRTPAYPIIAKQIHLSGSVSVEVMIAPDGRVEAARAVNGHPLLTAAAVEAARGWRFEPTLLNGTAVRVTGVIVFNFTMQ
jgi:TonB family protein